MLTQIANTPEIITYFNRLPWQDMGSTTLCTLNLVSSYLSSNHYPQLLMAILQCKFSPNIPCAYYYVAQILLQLLSVYIASAMLRQLQVKLLLYAIQCR